MPLTHTVVALLTSAADTVRAGSGMAVGTLASLIYPASTQATLVAVRLNVTLKADETLSLIVDINQQQGDAVVPDHFLMEAKSDRDVSKNIAAFLTPRINSAQAECVFVKLVMQVLADREINHFTVSAATLLDEINRRLSPYLVVQRARFQSLAAERVDAAPAVKCTL